MEIMKHTIYISDLDGTLLNSNKEVSEQCCEILNELIEKEDLHFSIATARTPATVEILLKDIKIKEPIVVMNGVALYDLHKHKYVSIEYLGVPVAKQVIKRLGVTLSQGFVYTIDENYLTVYYNELIGKGRINFFEERKNLQYKKFVQDTVPNYDKIIYFVFIDKIEEIQAIYDKLSNIQGLDMVMYKDIYDEEAYLLEVYSDKATKAKGIEKLKKLRNFDKIICFGDHLNDLSMFELANEAYAVANAVDEVKEAARAVIGDNESHSVATFIKRHHDKRKKEETTC